MLSCRNGLLVLFITLVGAAGFSGNLKSLSNFSAGISTGDALAEFERSGLPKTLDALRTLNSSGINSFKPFGCSSAKVNPLKINIVYEVHGTGSELNKAKSLLIRDAGWEEQSILLLESDTNRSPRQYGLRRTLAKYGFRGRDTTLPATIRGMDSDLRLRNIWFLPPMMGAIYNNPEKGVESLVEEMISNPSLVSQLNSSLKSPKLSKKTKQALSQLLFRHSSIAAMRPAYKGPLEAWISDLPDKKSLVGVLNRILEAEIKDHVGSTGAKERTCNKGKGIEGLERCVNQRNEDLVLDAGFNRRDQVFVNEIGKAICDASKLGISSINVSVGAGHKDNLYAGLKRALRGANVHAKVSVSSLALEDWKPEAKGQARDSPIKSQEVRQ